jgi:hypothetical protein
MFLECDIIADEVVDARRKQKQGVMLLRSEELCSERSDGEETRW